jgi:uncharacterized protein
MTIAAIIWTAVAVLAAYGVLVALIAIGQRGLIYFPTDFSRDPAQAGVPEMVAVPVRAADGLVVTGWYAPPRRSGYATVVLFHGNTGNLSDRAAKARGFLDAGFGVFLVGYRGYGGNPGHPSEQGFYADARAVLTWLICRGEDSGRIALYGESLGTGVAMQMATEFHPGAVMLEAPFTSLVDLAPLIVVPPLPGLLMVDRYDNLGKIAALRAPLLVMHGDQDTTVPVNMGRVLLAAATGDKEGLFVPAAGHNDLWSHGAGTAAMAFLRRRLAVAQN